MPQGSGIDSTLIGQRSKQVQEADHQSEAIKALREAQTANLRTVNEFVRESVQSLNSTGTKKTLNESMIAEAIADYLLQGRPGTLDSETRRVGEEVVVDKINDIFNGLTRQLPKTESMQSVPAQSYRRSADSPEDPRRKHVQEVSYEPVR